MQQEVQRKEELSAAKVKMDRMMNELQKEYRSNLKKKDEEIQALKHIIAEQSQVCATHTVSTHSLAVIGTLYSLLMLVYAQDIYMIMYVICMHDICMIMYNDHTCLFLCTCAARSADKGGIVSCKGQDGSDDE